MSVTERLSSLKRKHETIEESIHAESVRPYPDEGKLLALKKQKLAIKDALENLS